MGIEKSNKVFYIIHSSIEHNIIGILDLYAIIVCGLLKILFVFIEERHLILDVATRLVDGAFSKMRSWLARMCLTLWSQVHDISIACSVG